MPKIVITFIMATGMILTPFIHYLCYAKCSMGTSYLMPQTLFLFIYSGPRELFVFISILLPLIGIGIYPDFVLSLSVDKAEAIISNVIL